MRKSNSNKIKDKTFHLRRTKTHLNSITAQLDEHDDEDDDNDDDDNDDDEHARSITSGTLSLLFLFELENTEQEEVRSTDFCQYDSRNLPVFLS